MTVIELKNRLNKLIESGYEDWEVVGNKEVEFDVKVFE